MTRIGFREVRMHKLPIAAAWGATLLVVGSLHAADPGSRPDDRSQTQFAQDRSRGSWGFPDWDSRSGRFDRSQRDDPRDDRRADDSRRPDDRGGRGGGPPGRGGFGPGGRGAGPGGRTDGPGTRRSDD